MITLKNNVRKIRVNKNTIIANMQKILHILNYDEFDIGILLTTNKTIRTYNKQYRGKDKPTDILSFSYHPDLKPGQRIKPKTDDDKNLGDLIISLEYVQEDAKKWEQTFEQRMKILLVHGVCHLLGYDHEKDEEYEVMHKKEQEILQQL